MHLYCISLVLFVLKLLGCEWFTQGSQPKAIYWLEDSLWMGWLHCLGNGLRLLGKNPSSNSLISAVCQMI